MATTIKLKNSVTATNAPTSLVQGEVAINITDKKVWVGNAATTPVLLLGSGADGTFTNLTVSGVASFADGTVSLPSITNIGDTNTGIYFPAADTIAFTEGGAESMRITSAGDVGIGISSPSGGGGGTTLNIYGSSASSFRLSTSTSTGDLFCSGADLFLQETSATGALILRTGSSASERMRIVAGGEVGIGVTAPTFPLEIQSNSAAFGVGIRGRSDGISVLRFLSNNAATNYGQFDVRSTEFGINAVANIPMLFSTNNTERMRIDSSGNVGIGTSSIGAKLDVVGLGRFNVDANGTSTPLKLVNNSTTGTVVAKLAFENLGTVKASINAAVYNADFLAFNTGSDTERMRIDSSGRLGIGTSSPSALLTVNGAAWTTPGAPWQGTILAYNTNALGTDVGAGLLLGGVYQSGLTTEFAQIVGAKENATSGNYAGNMIFYTRPNGTTLTERMRIASDGAVLMGKTVVDDTTAGFAWRASGYLTLVRDNSCLNLNRITSDGEIVQFRRSATQVGNISVTTTATAYNTSSDYRLKENIAPLTGALATVSQLKPVTYNWKSDGSSSQGFIAHELQAVVPDCVTGEKDAVETVDDVDADGKVIGTKEVPKYQGIDTSFLVATLTAAIQEQQAMIEQLTTRLNALEGK